MSEMIAIAKERKSTTTIPKKVSLEDYFRLEEKSLHKNEYHDGIIVPMAGAKLRHNLLASKINFELQYFAMLEKLDYKISNSDTKIRIDDYNKVVYPDAVVICANPEFYNNREDTICNPLIIVEVLSPSTKNYDRTTKFEMYRTVPSFKEYVLIHQDRPRVSVWTKQDDTSWILKDYVGVDAIAELIVFAHCPIPLERLYQGI
jgi:Uma2 family endonuclease